MRRRSALFALFFVLAASIGPGAVIADGTRPIVTTIDEDESLTLYSFAFDEHNEIPWDQDKDGTPDPYEATLTAYVVAGAFAFFAENAVIKLPPDSDCLEIQTATEEGGEWFYDANTPASTVECLDACLDICKLPAIDDPLQAVILKAGTVVFVPANTACFVCAIGAGTANLDITVSTEDAGGSWARAAIPAVEATPAG